jgi:hypothetical protein
LIGFLYRCSRWDCGSGCNKGVMKVLLIVLLVHWTGLRGAGGGVGGVRVRAKGHFLNNRGKIVYLDEVDLRDLKLDSEGRRLIK